MKITNLIDMSICKNRAIILLVKVKEHIVQVKSVYKNQSICHMSDVDDYLKNWFYF